MTRKPPFELGTEIQAGEYVGRVIDATFDIGFGQWLFTAQTGDGRPFCAWERDLDDIRTAAEPQRCQMCRTPIGPDGVCPKCKYKPTQKTMIGQTDRTLRRCLGCENFFEARGKAYRCDPCGDNIRLADTFGAIIAAGSQLSQREQAKLKQAWYEAYTLLTDLEARKAEFMRRAMEQAEALVREAEAMVGRPIKELRAQHQVLEQRLKNFLNESGQTKTRVRDLLVEVQDVMVNRGGVPQPTVIYEKLRQIAKISEDELQAIIKASYSEPKFDKALKVDKLPPGRIRRQRGGSTVHVERDGKHYVLSKRFVDLHGVDAMVARQQMCKQSLSVSRRKGDMLMVTGTFAMDPNSVRAFIADTLPGYEIAETSIKDRTNLAIRVRKEAQFDINQALGFLTMLIETTEQLAALDDQLDSVAAEVSTASISDTPDPIEDFAIKRERLPNQIRPGGTPQEGIMQSSGGNPIYSVGG